MAVAETVTSINICVKERNLGRKDIHSSCSGEKVRKKKTWRKTCIFLYDFPHLSARAYSLGQLSLGLAQPCRRNKQTNNQTRKTKTLKTNKTNKNKPLCFQEFCKAKLFFSVKPRKECQLIHSS